MSRKLNKSFKYFSTFLANDTQSNSIFDPNLPFTTKQEEVLVGYLLGDGNLQSESKLKNPVSYRLRLLNKSKEFIDFLYSYFNCYVKTPPKYSETKPDKRTGNIYTRWWFNTVQLTQLRTMGEKFYVYDEVTQRRIKILPDYDFLYKYCTPLAIAVLFMSDGSSKSSPITEAARICTDSFTETEVELLIRLFEDKYGIICTKFKQRENYRIYITAKSFPKFKALIKPYMIDSMLYKFDKLSK